MSDPFTMGLIMGALLGIAFGMLVTGMIVISRLEEIKPDDKPDWDCER